MAREEYLLHAGEDTIHDPNQMKNEMDPKKKRENFWFYHKWHVIIGVVILIIAVWTIHDIVSKVHPDYTIGLITTKACPANAVTKLEQELAVKGKDINGDGKVVVSISTFNIASVDDQTADMNMQQAAVTRLMGDFQTAESMIFIVDDESLKRYTDESPIFAYKDGSTPVDGATDYENMGTKWSQIPYLANLDLTITDTSLDGASTTYDIQQYFSSLNVCMRAYKGTWLEGKPNMVNYHNNCQELLDSLQTK